VFLENIRRAMSGDTANLPRVQWGDGNHSAKVLEILDAALETDAGGGAMRLRVLVKDRTVVEQTLRTMLDIHNDAKERVSESRTLLREMNHRVKNNLQIVCALIQSQGDGLNDPAARSSFRDIESRVRTIAHLHDRLAMGFGTLDAAAILRDLAGLVAQSTAQPAERIVLDLENAPRPLSLAQALPFAMAANELLMNSIQHGNPAAPVKIQLRALPEGAFRLTVRNSSPSAPEESSPGLGLEIVHALCRQLGATFHSEFAWNEAACHLVLEPAKEGRDV